MSTGLVSRIVHVSATSGLPFEKLFDGDAPKGHYTFSQLQFSGGQLSGPYARRYVTEPGGERGYVIPESLPGWLPNYRQQIDRATNPATVASLAKAYDHKRKQPMYARVKLEGGSPDRPIHRINHHLLDEVVHAQYAQYFKGRIEDETGSLFFRSADGSERHFYGADGSQSVLGLPYDRGGYVQSQSAEGLLFFNKAIGDKVEAKVRALVENAKAKSQ